MKPSGKTVCIIGGGASGITSAKACTEEGHDYVIYELYKTFGGLWRYRDEEVDGLGSVAAATIINSSKEISAFSDFPPRADYPNYMHNSKMIAYVEEYAKFVGCESKMHFEHKVLSVEKANSFDIDGRWSVTVRNQKTNTTFTKTFDAVVVCTGHHVKPSLATFPGQDKFRGQIIHTHSYKKPAPFADKRVVVVGIGNSGADVSVELSMVCPKVYLAARRGAWVVHRVGLGGKPFDTQMLRRYFNSVRNVTPYKVVCSVSEAFINQRFNHSAYRIKPTHRIHEQHITVNDALPNRILSGTIEMKNNIEYFTEDGVVFEGDPLVYKCDIVILATGYEVDFPFIDKSILPVCDNKVDLFKFVFIPNLQPFAHTLAFIALAQPIGPLFPIAEMHARWFALLLSGKLKLPSEEKMMKDVQKKHKQIEKRYYGSPRNTLQVDYINYMDELAELVGCRPNLSKLMMSDPKLWIQAMFGPLLPYQYRLEGPHKWEGARDALLTSNYRIKAPLKTRQLTDIKGRIIKDQNKSKTTANGYKKID